VVSQSMMCCRVSYWHDFNILLSEKNKREEQRLTFRNCSVIDIRDVSV
jgi:hypothetical protein